MTRFVFDKKDEFEKWITENATSSRYSIYISSENEVLLYPLKTSRPTTYAYFKSTDSKVMEEIVNRLTEVGFKTYRVKAIEFADDRPVGVKVKTE